MWQQSDQEIVSNQLSKQDKKIQTQDEKMSSMLTGDNAVDSVITTPQSQWSPYQLAVANLNPDLKARNKKYQSALNTKSVLENERVNLWQASEIMMNAYRDALNSTNDAANRMMAANSAQAAIQAWWAISWMWWLANNPAAAAQQRISAMNQANMQNMQIRSNADQNLANVYNSLAWVPSQLANISQANASIDSQAEQLRQSGALNEANVNLANAQAQYYKNWWWSSSSKSSSNKSDNSNINVDDMSMDDIAKALWLEKATSDWIVVYKDKNWTFYSEEDIRNQLKEESKE